MNHHTFLPPEPGPTQQRLRELSGVSMADLRFLAGKWALEFCAVVAAVLIATLVYIMVFRTPVFESEARLFIRLSQEQAPPRTLQAPDNATVLTPGTSDVTSEMDLLLNADLVERVIENAGLEDALNAPPPPAVTLTEKARALYKRSVKGVKDAMDEIAYALGIKVRLSTHEALVRQIRTSLGIQNTRGSNVVVLSVRWPDRQVPQALLQQYLDAFMQFRLAAFEEKDDSFFAQQRAEREAHLANIERQISELRTAGGVEDLDVQRHQLLADLDAALAAERSADKRHAAVVARLQALQARTVPGGPLVLSNLSENPVLKLLDERSIELTVERDRLAPLPRLDGRELAALDETLAGLTASTLRATDDYADEIARERDDAAAHVADARQRLATLAGQEARWNSLLLDRRLSVEQLEDTARRLEEAERARELRREHMSNIVLIQQPSKPALAVGTRNATVLTVGGIFALLAAAAWVTLREFLDDSIWRAGDLAGMGGVPLLGVTPRRRGGPVPDDFALVAAAVQARAPLAPVGSVAVLAAAVDARDPEARTIAFARALLAQGVPRIRVLNLGRWEDGQEAGPADGAFIEIVTPAAEARVASLANLGETPKGTLTLIAVPPLFSGVVSLRATQAADGVILDVVSGTDMRGSIESAVSWLNRHGGRLIGFVLADLRGFARSFVAS